MFLAHKKKKLKSFKVDLEGGEPEHSDEYTELVSDPCIQIVDKRWVKRRKEEWDSFGGEGSKKEGVVEDFWFIVIEYEESSL